METPLSLVIHSSLANEMLRQSVVRCARSIHTSRVLLAPKTSGPKATSQGFKRGGDSARSSKKSAGSFRFFEDHVHAGRYHKKSEANLSTISPFEGALTEGAVVRYTELQKQKLTQCGAFKKDQYAEVFPTPVTLVRPETKQLESVVNNAFNAPSSENRVCLVGERGIGKSTLLAHSLAIAVQNENAVVISIPHALRLVDGSCDYWFDSKLGTYTQPMYTKRLLDKIRHANATSLPKINLSKEYVIESSAKGRAATKFNTQHTLADLVKANVAGRQRGQILQILFDELLNQSKAPVFVAVDNFSALTASPQTAYRNTENKPLYLSDFQITNFILCLTSAQKSFQKGAVILSTSADDRNTLTLNTGLGLAQAGPYTPQYKLNRRIASQLNGVKPIEVSKLTKDQVSSLVGVLADAGAFRADELQQNTMEQLAAQKYVLSGNGNPLELIRSVVMYL